jgi:phospholipid N-methyltransferase
MTTAAVRPSLKTRGRSAFLRQFILNTGMVGAVAPSSRYLAREMVRGLDFERAKAVLEFGPGSGVISDVILQRLRPATTYLPIELNDEMVRVFRRRHPKVPIVHDSVVNVRRICDDHDIDSVDFIISGLPWASFPEPLQVSILEAVRSVLKPGGSLVTFGYHIGTILPAGRRFARLLPRYFHRLERTRVVWRNLPPAFVVRATTAPG